MAERFESLIQGLAEEFGNMRPLRGGSLIITVFGDAILPRGGTIWLGSLIKLLAPLGLSERLVRTSVFRLGQDGWIESTQMGRRSFYSVAASGERSFAAATLRIYAQKTTRWNENWRLLILPQAFREQRERLRKELLWLGFGALSAGVMGHPDPDMNALGELLDELDVHDDIVVMDAKLHEETSALATVIRDCWNLDELEEAYRQFIKRFEVLKPATCRMRELSPKEAFLARTLLIHEFRKVLLRDPTLPTALLPEDWLGHQARSLCKTLYARLFEASEEHLSSLGETASGPLAPAQSFVFKRFGGLGAAA